MLSVVFFFWCVAGSHFQLSGLCGTSASLILLYIYKLLERHSNCVKMSQSLTLTASFFSFSSISQLVFRIWIWIHTFIIETNTQIDFFLSFMQVCDGEAHIILSQFTLSSCLFSKSIRLLTKIYYRHLMFNTIIILTINVFVTFRFICFSSHTFYVSYNHCAIYFCIEWKTIIIISYIFFVWWISFAVFAGWNN